MNIHSIAMEASKKFCIPSEKTSIPSDVLKDVLLHKDLTSFSKVLVTYLLSYKTNMLNFFVVYPSYKYLTEIFNVKQATIGNAIRNLKDNHIVYSVWDKNGRKFKRKVFYILLPLIPKDIAKDYVKFLSKFFYFDEENLLGEISEFKKVTVAEPIEETEEEDAGLEWC